jgi:HSP20 family molecular chaperone IbpA
LVIRAEVPGLDPATDLEVTVGRQALHIHAQRPERKREGGHSEFRYGHIRRTVPLPATAEVDNAVGRYEHGILEVTFPLGEERPERRNAPVVIAVTPPVR